MLHIQDILDLYARHPGALAARLTERLGGGLNEVQIGAFVQDIAEDHLYERDGILWSSDGQTYTIGWCPVDGSWHEWDEVAHLV